MEPCFRVRLEKRHPVSDSKAKKYTLIGGTSPYGTYMALPPPPGFLVISVSLGRSRSPINPHIDTGIMFAIVLIKEVNSLFAMGIFNKENPMFINESVSRLMFCYYDGMMTDIVHVFFTEHVYGIRF